MRHLQLIFLVFATSISRAQNTGLFEGHDDVGNVLHKGSLRYDDKTGNYTITGSGSNIWFKSDQFQYGWKKMKGNFILQARGKFLGTGHEAHRKTGWMIRSSLDTSASMAAATVHGDGLTSLQYRKKSGEDIEETRSAVSAPDVLQLERRGNRFIMSVAHDGDPYTQTELSDLDLGDEVYVGLFVCAHNKDFEETAVFDNVRITVPAKENFVPYREYIGSNLELMDIQSGKRDIVYHEPVSLQAPNWSRDGKFLIYNKQGQIFHFDLKKRKSTLLSTGTVKNNNNDHVLSFNGKMLGLSATSPDGKYNSVVYTVPLKGGQPTQITPTGPSYLHSWSPDGKYLIFTGQRNDEFDIYRVPSTGGEELRLTTNKGLDDGSEYSPDGKYIYFNSVRSGTMQIWRMNSDGSNQVALTSDEYNNWFPHVSPDNQWIVFLSFGQDVKPDDHPFYKHVYLRLMPVDGGKPKVIAYLYGGQGTINTPSWSPDSKRIAFISNSD
ncbi:MAG: biopolymer transporter TolR [Flavisolibacter sp.]